MITNRELEKQWFGRGGRSVRQSQCPVCYSPLEVRDVTPCFVCGGWPESVARFETDAAFTEFRLPGGQPLVLCQHCKLEEFMVPGGWGYRLSPCERLPVNALACSCGPSSKAATRSRRQSLPGVQRPASVRGGDR